MKKWLTLFILVLSVFLVGCNNDTDNTDGVDYVKDHVIDKSTLKEKFEQEETFVLVIAEATCGACKTYRQKTLNTYLKNESNINLYVLYISENFSSLEERKAFFNEYGIYNFKYTPSTYYVKNGVPKDLEVGAISLNDLEKFIAKNQKES